MCDLTQDTLPNTSVFISAFPSFQKGTFLLSALAVPILPCSLLHTSIHLPLLLVWHCYILTILVVNPWYFTNKPLPLSSPTSPCPCMIAKTVRETKLLHSPFPLLTLPHLSIVLLFFLLSKPNFTFQISSSWASPSFSTLQISNCDYIQGDREIVLPAALYPQALRALIAGLPSALTCISINAR